MVLVVSHSSSWLPYLIWSNGIIWQTDKTVIVFLYFKAKNMTFELILQNQKKLKKCPRALRLWTECGEKVKDRRRERATEREREREREGGGREGSIERVELRMFPFSYFSLMQLFTLCLQLINCFELPNKVELSFARSSESTERKAKNRLFFT